MDVKPSKRYSREALVFDAQNTDYAARAILASLLKRIPPIKSAVDLGCGAGTWLAVLREMGVTDILGVDGAWVDPDVLRISPSSFEAVDLSQGMTAVHRRYDLAISLEVAEHLPPSRAPAFVSTLTQLSDFVLFSAAIPYQDGQGHMNCRWQDYWVGLFRDSGYGVHDFLRAEFWSDPRIPFWYKQNMLFFSRSERSGEVSRDSGIEATAAVPLNLVHPDWYLPRVNGELDFLATMVLVGRVLRRRLPRRVQGWLDAGQSGDR